MISEKKDVKIKNDFTLDPIKSQVGFSLPKRVQTLD